MPDEPSPPEFESFVVRFWHEPASRTWRGRVIHVSSRSTCDFVTLEQALAFVRQFVPVLPATRSTDESDGAIRL